MRVLTLNFHNVFPRKWQDEYNPIDLFSHAPRSGQANQIQCKPISNDKEGGEVEVLRMVAECFNEYDCLNFDRHEIEATIHDGPGPAWVEDLKWEDGSPMNDPEGSDKENEKLNDPLKTRGRTMNIEDPSGIDHEIFLHEAGTPLYGGNPSNRLTSTLMLLVCCTTFAVPNNFVDEFFKLLKETILPKDNTLPRSFYVSCIQTTSPPLSNWLCCDRTCSISMMAITTSDILPQFPPYILQKRQSINSSINIYGPFINFHCRSYSTTKKT